jgi:hypothetical protein
VRRDEAGYSIDHHKRVIHIEPCGSWDPQLLLPDDPDCSQSAQFHLKGGRRLGTDRIVGIPVIRYRYERPSKMDEVALAPQLGCDVMKWIDQDGTDLPLPWARSRFTVTRYIPGEPDRKVFEPPLDTGSPKEGSDGGSGLAEGLPHALGLQLVEQAHDVVRAQLHQQAGDFGVLVVVEGAFDGAHGRDNTFLLQLQLLLLDGAVRHGFGE